MKKKLTPEERLRKAEITEVVDSMGMTGENMPYFGREFEKQQLEDIVKYAREQLGKEKNNNE